MVDGPSLIRPVSGQTTGSFNEQTQPWSPSNPHRGHDIGAPWGTPIYAPCDGRVVAFTNNGDFGPYAICIDYDGNGQWFVLLAHGSMKLVSIGDWVVLGQKVGEVGALGKANGAHCHVQVCKDTRFSTNINDSIDPESCYITEEEMKRLDRIERIVAGYGMEVVPWKNDPSVEQKYWVEDLFPAGTRFVDKNDPDVYGNWSDGKPKMVMLAGENALAYCDRRGFSLGLGLGLTRRALRNARISL